MPKRCAILLKYFTTFFAKCLHGIKDASTSVAYVLTVLTVLTVWPAGRCRMALGMQSGEITDPSLSASSSLPEHGPTDARYIARSSAVMRHSGRRHIRRGKCSKLA